MDVLFPLLLIAGCGGMMAVMMWMMRGQGQSTQSDTTQSTTSEQDDEVTRLRAEVDQLRATQRDIDAPRDGRPGSG